MEEGTQLDIWVFADNVLLVLVQQVVEDFLVEKGDTFEIVTWARLEADNLVNQAIRLVR